MSWTKRGQAGAGAAPQPYVPAAPQAQPFGNQQNMYPNYPSTGNVPQPATQQQYWHAPPQPPPQPPQYHQQYAQGYEQQQEYPTNANQFYQQPQYNQNYPNQAYTNPQQNYQQNYYQNQAPQQNYPQSNSQNAVKNDGWEDNWDWGWDESAKQAQKAQMAQTAAQQPPVHQEHAFNNANVIEESFAGTDTWNWAMDDNKGKAAPAQQPKPESSTPSALPTNTVANNITPEPNVQSGVSNSAPQPTEEVRTLSDRDAVKERMPNLALGKRFHLENLTPQWSIESQMSQESSDGPLTHSESTYRSENHSRNSNSPGHNTDNSNFNYSQSGLDEVYTQNSEWSRQSDDLTLADSAQNGSRRESHDELSSSLQEMSLANHETPSLGNVLAHQHVQPRNVPENEPEPHLPPAVSPANLPPPVSASHPPPPSMSMPPPPPVSSAVVPPPTAVAPAVRPPSANLPLAPTPPSSVQLGPPPVSNVSQPPPPSSSASLPPPNFPPPSNSQNPFKRGGPFGHKSKASSSSAPVQPFPQQPSNANLASPAVVNKVSQQSRVPVGFEANLETTPDNSERPDQPQVSAFRPMIVPQQMPENLEVAPQNDRNEYLQTAHLSSGDYGENTDFTRNMPPPPGLRRMVVGQQEPEYSQSLNISGDEPPPGLSRMVPGQQTEGDNGYNQPSDNYMDRHVDGGPPDNSGRPYRQADGQQTPATYAQPPVSRASDRRPVGGPGGMNRMVPGEPSNDEYSQYQGPNFANANEQRVVTGVDRDFPIHIDAGPSDIREQNMDGSDYTEQAPRIVAGVGGGGDPPQEYRAAPDDQQRERTMEGENLQDLSVISSGDLTYSREQILDGADVNVTDLGADRNEASDSLERPATSSRRQSLNRVRSSGEESDRDYAFKASPRRDRHKTSRDRDRDRDKEGRYSRGDRKYDRDDRKSARDDRRPEKDRRDRDRDRDRRARDESPDARKHRRSNRSHRYETEDTDYYSDKERDRRRYREGSYASKPPRPEERERRREERERPRRRDAPEREPRDRRYADERERPRHRDRPDRRYRDIDPTRKFGNLRREKEEEETRRGEPFSSPSRADSREATATDEDAPDARRRADPHRRSRRHRTADPYYDGYGGGAPAYGADPYLAQRQQYEYYERLRLADPRAYMQVYQQLMAGRAPPPPADPRKLNHMAEGYSSLGYGRAEDRGSVHSGRSSTTGLKGNDTYYVFRHEAGSLRDAPSLRTDISDRDLNTDASLNLHLEESTVRSERMTPHLFSTAHMKGSISSRHLVVVQPSYPVDGLPATVQVLSLPAALAADPSAAELVHSPGPLVKDVTHKKSVIEYCALRVRDAAREAAQDAVGYVLLWDLLALLLRQNGVVVGSDIAELLMKNTREYEYKTTTTNKVTHNAASRRASSASGSGAEARGSSPDQPDLSVSDTTRNESAASPAADERAAVDRLREYLIYGNRQEALEWAMSNNLWGHALQLAAYGDRRTRAGAAARFLAATPRTDPLHTLYATLAAARPPAATCVSEARWGDWRPHAAIVLSNAGARHEHAARTMTQLGDSLASRGLLYSAQFCYVSAGEPFARHPLAPLPAGAPPPSGAPPAAPPRLALLLADPRAASLQRLATNRAILATEIYEYALSLNQDYVITELQVYKFVLASRLCDIGQYERALAYVEQAARAVTRAPQHYSRALIHGLAELADRLKYADPALEDAAPPEEEGAADGEGSPRHQQWLHDVTLLAHTVKAESESQPASPQRAADGYAQQQHPYSWADPAPQYQQPTSQPPQPYVEPEETPDYAQQYYAQQQIPQPVAQPVAQPLAQPEDAAHYSYADWNRTEEHHAQSYAEPSYWQGDGSYTGYGETTGGGAGAEGEAAAEEPRPMITMPGASPGRQLYADYDDDRPDAGEAHTERDTDTPKSPKQEAKGKDDGSKPDGGKGKGGWLGGILTKLSLRAPNQMILPDDKNPSIIWDEETKRWKNLDGDDAGAEQPPPPPPRMADLVPQLQQQNASTPAQAPPGATAGPGAGAGAGPGAPPAVSNIFKMQKGRHIKKSYVDVFNPSGAATRPRPPAAEVLGPAPALAPAPAFFVPAPAPAPAQTVHVAIPPSPSTTPLPSLLPRPPDIPQGGIYEPAEDDDRHRSGI